MASRLLPCLALALALPLLADDAADKATFEKVCGACHAPSMVSDVKTHPEWVETVDQMATIGAKGTDEQFAAVLRYLVRNFTRVNVNTAPAEELAVVLDMNDTVAAAMVAYREQHGRFQTLDDVKKVPGMDAAHLDARRDRVAFR